MFGFGVYGLGLLGWHEGFMQAQEVQVDVPNPKPEIRWTLKYCVLRPSLSRLM